MNARDRAAEVLSACTTCDGSVWPTELHYRQADALDAAGLLAHEPDEIAKIRADAIRDAAEDIDLNMFFHSMQDRELAEQAAGAWLYDHAEVIQERGNEQ